ncbi:MAG: HAMP domain-containing histidine kinase, partial [Deltaproteobacteria bacterium]|nr:HAMP domain-containing histidine kinase [Deltaproteobacteria bacterium]
MEQIEVHTEFAPAEFAPVEEIQRQRLLFQDMPLMTQMVDAVPDILLVLNRERQMVYANRSLYHTLGIRNEDTQRVFGCRPGEILKCVHAFESEGGCGTTTFCSTCGAVKAILSSQENRADVQECRIIQDETGDALDLRIWAKPLVLGDEVFTIFTVVDTSHEKRREALERIFFHDILNTAGGLKGSAELIREADSDELNEFQDIIVRLSNDLIEEIQGQRQLAAAEKEELAAHPTAFGTGDILKEIAGLYVGHEVTRGRHIRVDEDAYGSTLITDRALLRRVIGNMTKNALEASNLGETVTLGCETDEQGVAFWVHNPGFIPPKIQL